MVKSIKGVWVFFAIFGFLFAAIPTIAVRYVMTSIYTLETEAVITDIASNYNSSEEEYEYTVYIRYQIDGKTYNEKLNNYSSSYYSGKEITILVNKNNYKDVIAKNSVLYTIPGVFITIGGIFFIIGIIGIVVVNNNQKKIEKVRRTGSTVVASYIGTRVNSSYSVNGKHPYNVICKWTNPQDNKEYTFKSENVWRDPTHEIEGRHIDTFRVFVNPNNFYEYSVDIDNIKNDLM